MKKYILVTLFAYCFVSSLAAETQKTTDWASKYNNGGPKGANNTNNSNSNSPSSNYKDFYIKTTCAPALEKANQAISDFIGAIKGAKTQWDAFGAAQKLNGASYYLKNGCKAENITIENQGVTGINKTEDRACEKLAKLISPLIGQGEKGHSSSNYMESFQTSSKAFGLQNKLGNNCNLTVVDNTTEDEKEEEEEESIQTEEENEEESEKDEKNEEGKEIVENNTPSMILLSTHSNHISSHSQNKSHADQEEEEDFEDLEEEEDEEQAQEWISINEEFLDQDYIQKDSYIIYYESSPNGADLVIIHTSTTEPIDIEPEENKKEKEEEGEEKEEAEREKDDSDFLRTQLNSIRMAF